MNKRIGIDRGPVRSDPIGAVGDDEIATARAIIRID